MGGGGRDIGQITKRIWDTFVKIQVIVGIGLHGATKLSEFG